MPLFLRSVAREHALDVFRKNIELYIYQVAGLDLVDVGVAFGVGDYPDGEAFLQQVGDREADPVYRDGTFVSCVMGEVRRQLNLHSVILAGPLK